MVRLRLPIRKFQNSILFSGSVMFRKTKLSVYLVCLLFVASCKVVDHKVAAPKLLGFQHSYCSPTVPYLQYPEVWEDSLHKDLSKTNISAHDLLVCQILGLSDEIDALWALRYSNLPSEKNQYVLLKQNITARLLLAQSQLEAVAGELDCEGERSDLAASYLDGINSKRNTKLTVASVIVGALTTVGTVIVSGKTGQTMVGVGGGLLSAGLGAMTISPKGKKVEFYHERNLLQSIWKEPAVNTEYPVFVWKMLQDKQFSNNKQLTLAQSIKNRWLQFEFDGEIKENQEILLFGRGGFYHADDLHTRSAMINQLQSTIRSVFQDLASFAAFTEQI